MATETEIEAVAPFIAEAWHDREQAQKAIAALDAVRSHATPECDALVGAAHEMLACFDAKFPKGQSKVMPGVTWYVAAESLRDALAEFRGASDGD